VNTVIQDAPVGYVQPAIPVYIQVGAAALAKVPVYYFLAAEAAAFPASEIR
jgi:hypothetical protein